MYALVNVRSFGRTDTIIKTDDQLWPFGLVGHYIFIDPRGRSIVTVGSDHYFPKFRSFVPTFQNLTNQNKIQVNIVLTTGGTVGLAEWIIDNSFLVNILYSSYSINVFVTYSLIEKSVSAGKRIIYFLINQFNCRVTILKLLLSFLVYKIKWGRKTRGYDLLN